MMEKTLAYTKNVALAIVGFLVLFAGIGAIMVVLDAATWEELGDWTLKAVLVAAIIFIISGVSSLIVGALTKKQ